MLVSTNIESSAEKKNKPRMTPRQNTHALPTHLTTAMGKGVNWDDPVTVQQLQQGLSKHGLVSIARRGSAHAS
jgi:hypothetical protein